MRTIQIFILCLLTGLTLLSCSKDNDNCNSSEIAYINEIEAPETAKVNETVPIDVTFSMKNTCGNFSRFVKTSDEQGKMISVEADYTGCKCGQAFIEDTQTWQFTPQSTGDYDLHFRSSPSEFITVTMEVTE